MTQMQTEASQPSVPPADRPPAANERYAWYVVFVLVVAYIFSYIDRQILTLLVQPIKASLGISDVQISLLHGLAFALFYTILGIPIARLADQHRRTTIISIGIFIWSLMTAACGLARSFGALFATRVGVGVGEAALSPAAYSMLSDYFPPQKLARALSVYTGAIYYGAGLAMIAGGTLIGMVSPMTLPVVGHLEPWQSVFMIVGLPGILIALWTMTLREPPRKGVKATDSFPRVGEVAAYVWQRRGAYLLMILGFSASSLMWNGVSSWIATYFIRCFAWTPAEVGLRFGLVLLVLGSTGIMFGGWLSDWFRAHGHTDSNLRVGIASALGAVPCGMAAPLVDHAGLSLALFALFVFAASMPYGGAAAAFQEITPNRMRAQVSAVYFFGLNLAGIGLGPTVVALFTEMIFAGGTDLRYALAVTVALAAPLSVLLLWRGCRYYRRVFAETKF